MDKSFDIFDRSLASHFLLYYSLDYPFLSAGEHAATTLLSRHGCTAFEGSEFEPESAEEQHVGDRVQNGHHIVVVVVHGVAELNLRQFSMKIMRNPADIIQ
jgi:hypothetical protein